MPRHHNDAYIESRGLQDSSYIVVIDCNRREIDNIIPMRHCDLAGSLAPSSDARWLYFTAWPGPDNPFSVGKLDMVSEEIVPEWVDPDETGLVAVDLVEYKVAVKISYTENPDIPMKGMALTPDDTKLFVPDPPSRTVAVIDTTNNTTIDRIPVANNPSEIKISRDGKCVYVLQQLCLTLMTVINVDTHEVLESIDFPFGIHRQMDSELSPDEGYVYVPAFNTNIVLVFDLQRKSVVKAVNTGLDPFNSVSTPDMHYIYVGDITSDIISIVDTTTNSVVKTIKLNRP